MPNFQTYSFRLFSPSWWKSVVLLTLITLIFALPKTVKVGTNIVSETYRQGSLRFKHGDDPYRLPVPGGDRYEYSPFFAIVHLPFALLPKVANAVIWVAANCLLFWMGVFSWFRFRKENWRWMVAPLLACSMEMNISVLYQQVNSAMIGLTLLSLALLREQRLSTGGVLLTIATNLKPLPLFFAAALLFPVRKRLWQGFILGTLLCLLTPALRRGFLDAYTLHEMWLTRMFESVAYVRFPQLDVNSVFTTAGYGTLGLILQILILASSLVIMAVSAWKNKIEWRSWITLGTTAILLVNPRSESPTFVYMAPSYLLLAEGFWNMKLRPAVKTVVYLSLLAAMGSITFIFTDLWPRWYWPNIMAPRWELKTLGSLLIWCLALIYNRLVASSAR